MAHRVAPGTLNPIDGPTPLENACLTGCAGSERHRRSHHTEASVNKNPIASGRPQRLGLWLRRQWRRSLIALMVATIAILSLVPQPLRPEVGLPGSLDHFVAYAITAATAAVLERSPRAWLFIGSGLALLAAILEVAQHWSPGREPNVLDFMASALGAFAGAWAGHVLGRVLRKRSNV